jgi:hypothetical protein
VSCNAGANFLITDAPFGEEKGPKGYAPATIDATCATSTHLYSVCPLPQYALERKCQLMCYGSWRRVLGDVSWVTPLSSGSKAAVLGKGNRCEQNFPCSSFVIITKGKTLYLLVLYARVEQNTRAYETNYFLYVQYCVVLGSTSNIQRIRCLILQSFGRAPRSFSS